MATLGDLTKSKSSFLKPDNLKDPATGQYIKKCPLTILKAELSYVEDQLTHEKKPQIVLSFFDPEVPGMESWKKEIFAKKLGLNQGNLKIVGDFVGMNQGVDIDDKAALQKELNRFVGCGITIYKGLTNQNKDTIKVSDEPANFKSQEENPDWPKVQALLNKPTPAAGEEPPF